MGEHFDDFEGFPELSASFLEIQMLRRNPLDDDGRGCPSDC
jgi:hypothetical protein